MEEALSSESARGSAGEQSTFIYWPVSLAALRSWKY